MAKANWGSGGAGLVSGAAGGAAVGSVVPVVGTAVGAVGGGILGLISGLFGGGSKKKDKVKQISTLTPEQQNMMKLIDEAITKGTGPLADVFGEFNEEKFKKGVADPALKNFQENILPQIQEKFIAGNQVAGSGMRRGQIKGATDLQSELARLLYQAQEQQKQNKIAGINALQGTRGFENIYQKGEQNPIAAAGQGIISNIGEKVGSAAVDALFKPKENQAPAPTATGQPVTQVQTQVG